KGGSVKKRPVAGLLNEVVPLPYHLRAGRYQCFGKPHHQAARQTKARPDGGRDHSTVAQWRTIPCGSTTSPPSIVPPSGSTGSSTCSIAQPPTAAPVTRPTTSSAPARTATASRLRFPAS